MDLTPCLLILGIFLPWNGCGFSQPLQLDTSNTGNAVCNGTATNVQCVCKQGFKTFRRTIVFKPQDYICYDIDECGKGEPQIDCGLNAYCINTAGSYHCVCAEGYLTASGKHEFSEKTERNCTAPVFTVFTTIAAISTAESHQDVATPEPGITVTLRPADCVFPFIYRGQSISSCIPDGRDDGKHWCATTSNFDRDFQWKYCAAPSPTPDNDECAQDTTICGPHAVCTNTPGHYSCSCAPGFVSSTGGEWRHGETKCTGYFTDNDECAQNSAICGPHTVCINMLGNYSCSCAPGFASSTGGEWRHGETKCTDIDECAPSPSICGPHTTCRNRPGHYSCRCLPGFVFFSGGEQLNGAIKCTEIPLNFENENLRRCQSQPGQDSFCRLLISTSSIIQGSYEKNNETNLLQSTAEGFSQVLNQASSWSSLSREKVAIVATSVLETVESTILASLRRPGGNTRQNISTAQLDVETKVIEDDCKQNTLFTLSAMGDRMNIHCRTITGNRTEASGGVAFVSFNGMELHLNGSFFKDQDADTSETLRDIHINSRVVSGQITSEKKSDFSEPVNFTLENFQEKNDTQKVICVFWNATKEGGSWSRKGCKPLDFNRTHTVCSCYHLSSFAVIMAISKIKDDFTLQVLTYAGLTFSLLCLTFAIFTFILCRSIRNTNTSIHLQLCVCLFLAELLLLTGIKRTSYKTVCAIIAGLLHYLFLASFSWMFVEALMLFLTVRNLKVVNYFNTRKIKMLHLSLVGYGFPALIIIISASVKPGSYGTHRHCWLDTETGLVWSFLGPVCAFLLINSSLFVITLGILRVRLSTVNADVSTLKDTRLLTFKASAQLFILGCTWIFGLFQIDGAAVVMAYLFTIINSLQGAFIFLVHCVLNRQVREEYHRWFKRIHKPSSESQSSGTTTSTAAMTMKSMESTVQTS